jgi:4-amino-4-deoxy-L-arabinose transferase-like glycosyltransferase
VLEAHRRSLVIVALLVAIASGLSFHLGAEQVWRSSEERCYEVVNEIVRSGDWLVPRTSPNAEPRLQKPPLFYWLATVSAKLAGGPSVLTLRWVSVLASLASALTVLYWGWSIGGFSCGVASALSLAGTAMFVVRARYGDAEPLLALTTTLSLACFERLWRTRDARMLPLLAATVALAFLAKGTAAMLTIFAPIAVWLALHRALGLALDRRVLAWAMVAAIGGLAWYAAIALLEPGAFTRFVDFALHPVGASEAPESATHFRNPFYYLPRFPLQALPATLLLPWVIADGVRTRFWRDDERLRFIAVSFAAIFVAWSVVPQKQMHYLLPLTPFYALLCGHWISTRLARRAASD